MIIVFTSVSSLKESEDLAERIVAERLAACVQIMPRMTSVYFWDGVLRKEPEHLLLIKTLEEKFEELSRFICKNHSYDLPEIVAVSADDVSGNYLKWMKEYIG